MKVVFLRSNSINPDPRVEKEVKTLLRFGFEVIVLAWNRNEPNLERVVKIIAGKNIGIIIRKFIRGSYGKGIGNIIPLLRWQIFLFYWLIRYRRNYEIIHSCDFDTAIPALIMKVFFRKKFIYDIFDYYIHAFRVPKILVPFIYILDKVILKFADYIIIAHENRKEQIRIKRKVEVIYNTPEDCKYRFKANNCFPNRKFLIVYIGILSKDRFLLEMIDIVSRHLDWDLYIGGFGELENEIFLLSKRYENIKFLGRVPYEETLKISNNADVLFAIYNPEIPNHKYSSPNKVFEAMMLAKPIIVANGTGIDLLVKKENFGFCVNYGDKKEVEEVLEILQKNPNLRLKLGLNGRYAYENKYSWSLMEMRLLNLYRNLR